MKKTNLVRTVILLGIFLTVLTTAPTDGMAASERHENIIQKHFWQCVTYVRQITPIFLRGNAWTWWKKADGKYTRGNEPKIGAVLVFEKTRKMPMGHLAVVRRVVGDREVWVEHANWDRPGGRGRGRVSVGDRVVDVSENNDWSAVRVWSLTANDFGRINPAYGFIYSPNYDPRTGIEWQAAENTPARKQGDG